MNKTYILILSVLLFTSCSILPNRKDAQVQVNNRFSLDIPAEYQPQNDMHDFAGLQLAHTEKPFYLIGFTEPKNELRKLKLRFSLADYAHFATENLGEGFSWYQVSDTINASINGSPCIFTRLEALSCQGTSENDVAYGMAIFEARDYYSQLIAWAPANQKEELYTEMASLAGSFQDISLPDTTAPDPAYMGNPAGSGDIN